MKFKIFFSSLIKKCFIFFCIFLSVVIVSANATKGEVDSTSEVQQVDDAKNLNTAVIELPPESFSFQGVKDIQSPVKVKLKDNKVDLSSVTTSLNRATESLYDNLHEITETIQITYEEIVDFLCIKAKSKAACMDDSAEKLDDTYQDIIKTRTKEILYPYWYEEKDQDFSEALHLLNADCVANCTDYAIVSSLIENSDSRYHQLYDQIKNKDKRCQIDIVSNVAQLLNLYSFPGECMEEENKNHPVCKDMFKHAKVAKNRFLELINLAYGEDALTTTEASAICVECASIDNKESSNNLLLDAVNIAERNLQCRDLKPNEEKTVFSGTSSRLYNVKKEKDGSYSVPFILIFFPSEDYDGSVPQNKVSEYYMKKAQVCMKKANQKMLGPNGEKLKINIIPASRRHNKNICDRQKIIDIAIGSANMRSNAHHYAADIDCVRLTHEVLHLLGFNDEYKETKRGFYVNSKTGERTKIMKNRMEIKELMNNKNYEFQPAFNCRVIQKNSIMSYDYIRWWNVYNSRTNESLLDPGHFNYILYGDCAINQHFNECSQLAYNDIHDHPTCTEKKRQCESQNVLGRNKQKEITRIQEQIDTMKTSVSYMEQIRKPKKISKNHKDRPISDMDAEDIKISSQIVDDINELMGFFKKELSSLKEELRVVQSWPDP